jgi:hypothetical protein
MTIGPIRIAFEAFHSERVDCTLVNFGELLSIFEKSRGLSAGNICNGSNRHVA